MIINQIWQNGEDAKCPYEKALVIAVDAGYDAIECIGYDLLTGVISYKAIKININKNLN